MERGGCWRGGREGEGAKRVREDEEEEEEKEERHAHGKNVPRRSAAWLNPYTELQHARGSLVGAGHLRARARRFADLRQHQNNV